MIVAVAYARRSLFNQPPDDIIHYVRVFENADNMSDMDALYSILTSADELEILNDMKNDADVPATIQRLADMGVSVIINRVFT